MIGPYVRIVGAPNRVGRVIAARYHCGQIRYLFRSDPRLNEVPSEIWLPESQIEECSYPAEAGIGTINCRR